LSTASEIPGVYKAQTLAAWCAAHNEPFTLIEVGGAPLYRLPTLKKDEVVEVKSPPVFFGRLTDIAILPGSTFNCTSDRALIYAGLTHRDYAPSSDLGVFLIQEFAEGRYQLRLPTEMPTVEQECIFLGGRSNFGHFIFEGLMRWAVAVRIAHSDSLPVAVYNGLPARYYEFLDLVGIPQERRILIDPLVPTRFNHVWRASSPMYTGGTPSTKTVLWWPEGVRFIHNQVRSRALSHGSSSDTSNRPMLYVTRSSEKWRRILNEAEVVECIRRYGGVSVNFDGLSAKDQVNLVGNARAMILPIGAGASISLFAPTDCAIAEILPVSLQAYFGPWTYACCLSQPYARIVRPCATPNEVLAAGLTIHSNLTIDADYSIDCVALESLLKLLPH